MGESNRTIYLGTVRYLLSHRSYRDFIVGELRINQLPFFGESTSKLQLLLDKLTPRVLQYRGQGSFFSEEFSDEFDKKPTAAPFLFEIEKIYIESISFEEGSVYAKIKIVAVFSFLAYQGLADYKDAKEGLAELRADIISAANAAFGVLGSGPVDVPEQDETADVRYYFAQPRRIEDEIVRKRRGGTPAAPE